MWNEFSLINLYSFIIATDEKLFFPPSFLLLHAGDFIYCDYHHRYMITAVKLVFVLIQLVGSNWPLSVLMETKQTFSFCYSFNYVMLSSFLANQLLFFVEGFLSHNKKGRRGRVDWESGLWTFEVTPEYFWATGFVQQGITSLDWTLYGERKQSWLQLKQQV